jgi:ferredoxin
LNEIFSSWKVRGHRIDGSYAWKTGEKMVQKDPHTFGSEELQGKLESLLCENGVSLAGFGDISKVVLPDRGRWQSALVFGVAFDAKIIEDLGKEVGAFEKNFLECKRKAEKLLDLCAALLKKNGVKFWVPPASKNLPGLLGDFSHKMAATKAGLGWVGKNSLFVSRRYGCGLFLSSVLTDRMFRTGNPATESSCGGCTECVRACPYGAIKGETWYPGLDRDSLIDAFLCSRKREEFIPELGYKHPCGLCIRACPVNFNNIEHLQYGTERQRQAYRVLKGLKVLDILKQYDAVLAGTVPLNISVADSDLDVLCESRDQDQFCRDLKRNFSRYNGFLMKKKPVRGVDTVIASFSCMDESIEIFCQPVTVTDQYAYRHMMVESRLLRMGGWCAVQEIVKLKKSGMKTEPAFAHYFGVEGDVYQRMYELYDATDEQMKNALSRHI